MLLSKKWETVLTTRAPVVLKSKRIKVTLTTTKDKEFTGFCAWVKVESTKLCLNSRCSMIASWCERMFTWQPPRLIGWLQMAFLGLRPPATQFSHSPRLKVPMLKRNPPWSWIAWTSAPVGPPHVEMHDSSDWKLFVLPPQPPYENNRHRSASCRGKFWHR